MPDNFFRECFLNYGDRTALIWNNRNYTYSCLVDEWSLWAEKLNSYSIKQGQVVALEADYSPNAIAIFFALIEKRCIIVPLSSTDTASRDTKLSIAQAQTLIRTDQEDNISCENLDRVAEHPYYSTLRSDQRPGLVLFSSGTSGEPKAAVHDFSHLLKKFETRREAYITINFLLFDHWGGLNTMLHTLSNGGTVVSVADRSPDTVCHLIEATRADLLPTSPTFLNLLLLSAAIGAHDLSSLKVITYGTEPMLQTTLDKIRDSFPNIKLQQTYGLIEVGVLRASSRGNNSLWMKLGGEGYQTRVVDGILQIKSRATIMGYLNAETPITEDGWFITGDKVVTDGDYVKILGRNSEIINVGGNKVFPQEVENVIQQMDGVREVIVYGEQNFVMGNILCANIRLASNVEQQSFRSRINYFCQSRLESYKVPTKIHVVDYELLGARLKKIRTVGKKS